MSKKFFNTIVVLLLVVGQFFAALPTGQVKAAGTVTVPAGSTTAQISALIAANLTDTEFIFDGAYPGGVVIPENANGLTFTLKNGTVITAGDDALGVCFWVLGDNTVIQAESVGGAKCVSTVYSNAILINWAEDLTPGNTVEGLVIDGLEIYAESWANSLGDLLYSNGIYVDTGVSDLIIVDNYIHDTESAIKFMGTLIEDNIVIKGNMFLSQYGVTDIDFDHTYVDETNYYMHDFTYNSWGSFTVTDTITGNDQGWWPIDYDPWTHAAVDIVPVVAGPYVDEVSFDVVGVLKNITAADFTLVYDTAKLEKVSISNVSSAFTSTDGDLIDEAIAGNIKFDGYSGTAVSSPDVAGTVLYRVNFKIKTTDAAHRLYIDPASDIFGMADPDLYSQNVYAASLADITFDGRPLDPAPVATLGAIPGTSNTIEVTFDRPVFLGGVALENVLVGTEAEKLAFLQTFFGNPALTAAMFDASKITIVLTAQSVTITLGDNAIRPGLFEALDDPDLLPAGDTWAGDGNGVYRIDVDVVATAFANRDAINSTSDLTPFKIKFSVPMLHGIPDYSAPIAAIFQTEEQREAEIDPLPDSTPPTAPVVTPAEGVVALAAGGSFVLTVDAFDENLYSLEIDHSFGGPVYQPGDALYLPEFTVYASAENPYGTGPLRELYEDTYGVFVTYDADAQKWTIDFGPSVSEMFRENDVTFYLVLHDWADNKWGSMDPVTQENTYVYTFVDPMAVTATDLTAAPAVDGTYTSVPGSLATQFTMVLDPAVPYYYFDAASITSTRPIADGNYDFYRGPDLVFTLMVSGGGTQFYLRDNFEFVAHGVTMPLRIKGTQLPLVTETFTGTVADTYGYTAAVSLTIEFVAPMAVTATDLTAAPAVDGTYASVPGSLATQFTMVLDPAVPYYYFDAASITSTRPIANGNYDFYRGSDLVFTLMVSDTGYFLRDNFEFVAHGVTMPLRIKGTQLPLVTETFTGTVADAYGYTAAVSLTIEFVAPLAVTDADLKSSTAIDGTYAAVPGTFADGFTMVLDPAVQWYYFDTTTITSNRLLKDGSYSFHNTLAPTEEVFTLVVSNNGTEFFLRDTWKNDGTPLRVAGNDPLGPFTFVGEVEDALGSKDTVSLTITFVAPLAVANADLFYGTDPAEINVPMGGDYAGGFEMQLDPAVLWYYLDTNSITTNNTLADGLYPFTLVGSPAAPIFYVKVVGTSYTLIDAWLLANGGGEQPLRINGDYFTGEYTFTGSLTDIYGSSATGTIKITFSRALAATITGTVSMQARTYTGGIPVTLTGDFGYGPYTEPSVNRISDNLTFTNTGKGLYTITTLQPRYLNITAAMARTINTYSDVVITPLRLVGGNAIWSDNVIDNLDLGKVSSGYKFGIALHADADVNYDNKINVQDLALVAGNFFLTSEDAYASWLP